MNRQVSIRKQILIALEQCGGFLAPEPVILAQINFHIVPPVTRSEFDAEIRFLDSRKHIIGEPSELGADCKWMISKQGRAALADF